MFSFFSREQPKEELPERDEKGEEASESELEDGRPPSDDKADATARLESRLESLEKRLESLEGPTALMSASYSAAIAEEPSDEEQSVIGKEPSEEETSLIGKKRQPKKKQVPRCGGCQVCVFLLLLAVAFSAFVYMVFPDMASHVAHHVRKHVASHASHMGSHLAKHAKPEEPVKESTTTMAPATTSTPAEFLLLQSDYLVSAIVDHTFRFESELGTDSVEYDNATLKEDAQRSLREFVEKVTAADESAGSVLSDIKLTAEQWNESADLLQMMHNEQVQDLGAFVQESVRASATLLEASEKVAEQSFAIRELRKQLVPTEMTNTTKLAAEQQLWSFGMRGIRDAPVWPPVHNVPEHVFHFLKNKAEDSEWDLGMHHDGRVRAAGQLGGWAAAVHVGDASGASEAPDHQRNDSATASRAQELIRTSVVVSILGTVLTTLVPTLGLEAASTFFTLTAGMDGVVCGLDHPHKASVPCRIMTAFAGAQAVLTFRRPDYVDGCPVNTALVGDKCLFIVTDPYMETQTFDFAAAEDACLLQGGQVASLHSMQEYLAAANLVSLSSRQYAPDSQGTGDFTVWTGAIRESAGHGNATQSSWTWVDGSSWEPPAPDQEESSTQSTKADEGPTRVVLESDGAWRPTSSSASLSAALCELVVF